MSIVDNSVGIATPAISGVGTPILGADGVTVNGNGIYVPVSKFVGLKPGQNPPKKFLGVDSHFYGQIMRGMSRKNESRGRHLRLDGTMAHESQGAYVVRWFELSAGKYDQPEISKTKEDDGDGEWIDYTSDHVLGKNIGVGVLQDVYVEVVEDKVVCRSVPKLFGFKGDHFELYDLRELFEDGSLKYDPEAGDGNTVDRTFAWRKFKGDDGKEYPAHKSIVRVSRGLRGLEGESENVFSVEGLEGTPIITNTFKQDAGAASLCRAVGTDSEAFGGDGSDGLTWREFEYVDRGELSSKKRQRVVPKSLKK